MAQNNSLIDLLHRFARQVLPLPVLRWLWAVLRLRPPVGKVRFGSLRRLTPISRIYGFDRGLPIDRYYIEDFLSRHADDVKGHVLEIKNATYTHQFGGDRVTQSDVLDVEEDNPKATIVADLTCADHIPSGIFDCIILTQTLQLIYDVRAALKTLYRILKPGGVLLATFPGISRIDYGQSGGSWYWPFTALSAQHLFEEVFPASELKVETHGNVLTAVAFLHGLVVKDLLINELDFHDPDYELLIAVRTVKPQVGI